MTGTLVKDMQNIKFNEPLVFYVFRVIVGRAYVMTAKEVKKDLQDGMNIKDRLAGGKYHSIYVTEEPKGEVSKTDYVAHSYKVFDKERCRLMYKVSCRVKIMPTVKNSNSVHDLECERCKTMEPRQNNSVSVFCINDKAYFCESCDNQLHQASSILDKHVRIPPETASQKFLDFGKCMLHDKRFEFFNTESCQALCSQCIITGDIQRSDNDKQILRIEVAYSNAKQEASSQDLSLLEKKNVIQSKLSKIMKKMGDIRDTAKREAQKLRMTLEKALNEINDIVKEKTD